MSATENPVLQKQIEISPNPFNTHLDVALNLNLHLPIFRLFDQTGRIVLEKRIAFGISEIETDMLPPGIYFWEVRSPTEMLKSGKLVKIKN